MSELAWRPAAELAALIRSRQVSPVAPDFQRWTQYREQLIAAWERML